MGQIRGLLCFVLLDDSIYHGKTPDRAKGKNFLYSVYDVEEDKDGEPTFVLKYEKKAVEAMVMRSLLSMKKTRPRSKMLVLKQLKRAMGTIWQYC